eukprot:8776970-Alexandrium_andersonii.AAC.1
MHHLPIASFLGRVDGRAYRTPASVVLLPLLQAAAQRMCGASQFYVSHPVDQARTLASFGVG